MLTIWSHKLLIIWIDRFWNCTFFFFKISNIWVSRLRRCKNNWLIFKCLGSLINLSHKMLWSESKMEKIFIVMERFLGIVFEWLLVDVVLYSDGTFLLKYSILRDPLSVFALNSNIFFLLKLRYFILIKWLFISTCSYLWWNFLA